MNALEYQARTGSTRLSTYTPEACVLGLLAEAGEIAAVFQKLIRGDYNQDVAATKLRAELGDVLWHVSEIARDNDWSIEDIMEENIDKLASRQLRNALLGSGDTR